MSATLEGVLDAARIADCQRNDRAIEQQTATERKPLQLLCTICKQPREKWMSFLCERCKQ